MAGVENANKREDFYYITVVSRTALGAKTGPIVKKIFGKKKTMLPTPLICLDKKYF